MSDVLRIGVVAGEVSGDALGADLINALREQQPSICFEGIAGPAMVAAGCEAWFAADELAVMGLAEVIGRLPRLLSLRRRLVARWAADPPDLFLGIDAPEFNLSLERRLHARGIPTVQYVSPQLWAWRPGRVAKIGQAVDLVLCLLPFEPDFYSHHGVAAKFVGHPLADQIPFQTDRPASRASLGIAAEGTVVAVLPGSRLSEVSRLGHDFARTVAWLHSHRPDMRFVAAAASAEIRTLFERHLAQHAAGIALTMVDGRAREVMIAADVVLLASGTATLEATLLRRPMVVAYRVARSTEWLVRRLRMITVDRYALPNLLAGHGLVPELIQAEITPASLGEAVLEQLEHGAGRARQAREFDKIHRDLKADASRTAANAVLDLLRTQTSRHAI